MNDDTEHIEHIVIARDQEPAPAQVMEKPESNVGFWGKLRQHDNFWMILAINFGITGALGLPLIWYSNKFAKSQKILWSVAVAVYTFILFGICATVCIWAYRSIANYS